MGESELVKVDKGVYDKLDREGILVLITIYELEKKGVREPLITTVSKSAPLSTSAFFRVVNTLIQLGLIEEEVTYTGGQRHRKLKLTELGREIAELLVKIRELYKERKSQI